MDRRQALLLGAGTGVTALMAASAGPAHAETTPAHDGDQPDEYGLTRHPLSDADKQALPDSRLRNYDDPIYHDGGDFVIRGTLHVRDPNDDTTSDIRLTGLFEDRFTLSKSVPGHYTYGGVLGRHRLEVYLDLQRRILWFQRCWRTLGVWRCDHRVVLNVW